MVIESCESGPSGGRGGSAFVDDVPADGVKVRTIRVWHGARIDALQLVYNDGSSTRKHGGDGGTLTQLDLKGNEYITELSGRYGDRVDSLVIRTNIQEFDQLGGNGGDKAYRYQVPEQNMEIVGFLGASGGEVDAIGIIARQRVSVGGR